MLPFFRSSGVRESSREETAGRLGRVVLLSMGIVALGDMAISGVGALDLLSAVVIAVEEDRQGGCFGCRDARLVGLTVPWSGG